MHFLFILLLWIDCVFSSHFNGGTISWQPLDSSDTTSPVSIAITQTYSWVYSVVSCNQNAITTQTPINTVYNNADVVKCISSCSAGYGYSSIPIARYCTDFSPTLGITSTQRVDIVQISANSSFSIAFSPASLAYWRPLQSVSAASTTTATWSITATINLNKRVDNGLVNTAPIANVISPIEIPRNTLQQITIPVIDANNDVVKCRWAKRTPINECMDVCSPSSLPAGVLLSTNCTLYVTGTILDAWYVAAIMVEDFLDASAVTPLSSIPVQFLIHVVQPANCSILPQITGLNVSTMACVGVQTTVQYTSTLFINNYCGSSVTIVAVSVQSFPGMVTGSLTTINSSLYSMSLTWTPTSSQIGLQILCAVAQDSQSQQSLQYCLVFSVAVGAVGSCPGTTLETTSVANVQTNTTGISTSSEETTNVIAETTETFIDTSTVSSMAQSTIINSTEKVSGTTINLPLIIGLSLLALLLALLCCFCCLYYFFWGAGRRRRRKQTKDRVKPLKNERYILLDSKRTSQNNQRFSNTDSLITRHKGSFCIENTFQRIDDRNSSTDISHLNNMNDSKRTSNDFISLKDTTDDNHANVVRVSQAEVSIHEGKKMNNNTEESPKMIPRKSNISVIHVQRISIAEKDKETIKPINEFLTQIEPTSSYPKVARISIVKEEKPRSFTVSNMLTINTKSKYKRNSKVNSITKINDNIQRSNRRKSTGSINVIKCPRIKANVDLNIKY